MKQPANAGVLFSRGGMVGGGEDIWLNTEKNVQAHGELEGLVGIVSTSWRCVGEGVVDLL